LAPELSDLGSLPEGAWLASTAVTLAARPELLERSFADLPVSGQAFAALNAAFFRDGFVLALEPGVALEHPVEIVNLSEATSPQSLHLRSAIVLGAGSRARLIETFAGSGETWMNAVTTISLGKDASLSHVVLQDQAADALHFLAAQADLAAGASYEGFVLTLGARLSRHDGVVRLQGKGAQCRLNGAYLLRGQQEATHATVVDHAAPGATTRELWKGVADERAHGVFLGRIAVRPEAQQTDAQLQNRNLLLSARAAIDTKPELEILADDVKCSHGATVGDLDESALFYLRARGIGEAEARRMLIEAFAVDALASIGDTVLREHLAARLRRWLGDQARVAA
jgi:Fe-S cluster assembly protein SufD